MCAIFHDEDVGKRVENANGDPIGTVTNVEDDVAHVEPSPGVVDSIRAALGWERARKDAILIDEDAVDEVTADVIRLETDPVEPDRPSAPVSNEPASGSESGDSVEPSLEPELETEDTRGPADRADPPASSAGTDPIAADDSSSAPEPKMEDGTDVIDDPDGGRRVDDNTDGDRQVDDNTDEDREIDAESAEGRPDQVDERLGDGEPSADDGSDSADEVNPGLDVDALEDAGRSDESAEDGPARDTEKMDLADEIDRGVDVDGLEDASESDDAEVEAVESETGAVDAGETNETDLAAELDRGADLDSVAETTQEGGVESTRAGSGEGRIDAETRPQTPVDRLGESADDARSGATDGARDEPSDGDRRSGFPVRALFAPQRAAIEGGRRAFESGLAVQRRAALNVLEGQKAIQRRQREATRTGTRTAFDAVAAVADAGESTVADDGESDRQDRRNDDETNRGD